MRSERYPEAAVERRIGLCIQAKPRIREKKSGCGSIHSMSPEMLISSARMKLLLPPIREKKEMRVLSN